MFGCGSQVSIEKPIVFKYFDNQILLNIILKYKDEKKGTYFGELKIANLSKKKLVMFLVEV